MPQFAETGAGGVPKQQVGAPVEKRTDPSTSHRRILILGMHVRSCPPLGRRGAPVDDHVHIIEQSQNTARPGGPWRCLQSDRCSLRLRDGGVQCVIRLFSSNVQRVEYDVG